ncbi:MAG: UDP-N-acetylmuramate dehydrogenase [Chlamydiia bacterium]|nr:UDP-N-acetylmuramate dehydrogenase [Chlamydiia bacterium]
MLAPSKLSLIENHPLAPLTTLRVGGSARYFVTVTTKQEAVRAVELARQSGWRFYLLGNGSNLYFDDAGFDGLIIHNRIREGEKIDSDHPEIWSAGAGVSLPQLALRAGREGWGGLEFGVGIPGSVGGAIVMNAGASGSSISDCLLSIECYDQEGYKHLSREEIVFGYRSSPFQKGETIILSAKFLLKRDPEAKKIQQASMDYRRSTQPYGLPSAGCIFRNPQSNGSAQSAGALIDLAGLKEMTCEGAQISSLHANFMINTGQATSKGVSQLIARVRKTILEMHGIELTPEMIYVPPDGGRQ